MKAINIHIIRQVTLFLLLVTLSYYVSGQKTANSWLQELKKTILMAGKFDGEKIRNYNVAYFTASVDDPETNRKFAESLELDYPILSDPAKETARAYGVLNDRGMANRWTFYIGKDGKILHVDRGVKAAQHGSDIAARLEQLGVEEKQS